MEPSTFEIHLRDADELRLAWLDGLDDGGLFLPGDFSVSAGSPVLLRVIIDRPAPTTTLLAGIVAWRRLPTRQLGEPRRSGINLRAGIGVSFAPSMRVRALFLDRLGRGSAGESRTALRYPVDLPGDLSARSSERATGARIVDVSLRGTRVALATSAFLDVGSAIELHVAVASSGEFSRWPLHGHVAWIERSSGQQLGVRLDLATSEERLIWAKIVTRARESLEAHPIRITRLVG